MAPAVPSRQDDIILENCTYTEVIGELIWMRTMPQHGHVCIINSHTTL